MISYVGPLLFSIIFSHHLLSPLKGVVSLMKLNLKAPDKVLISECLLPASVLGWQSPHASEQREETRGQCISTHGMAIPSAILYLEIELKY